MKTFGPVAGTLAAGALILSLASAAHATPSSLLANSRAVRSVGPPAW